MTLHFTKEMNLDELHTMLASRLPHYNVKKTGNLSGKWIRIEKNWFVGVNVSINKRKKEVTFLGVPNLVFTAVAIIMGLIPYFIFILATRDSFNGIESEVEKELKNILAATDNSKSPVQDKKENEVEEEFQDGEMILKINKQNDADFFGKSAAFDQEISLVNKLKYSSGIKIFDLAIEDSGKKGVIHLLKRGDAIEIKFAKLFSQTSVGIKLEHIKNINISSNKIIKIDLKNRQSIEFNCDISDVDLLTEFFTDELKLKVVKN